MKIAFGMIVFEGDYVLKECLEQVYPFASQILVAEGPVSYWQRQGRTTSTDNTNKILDEFPDPENKIKIVHGQFKEKDEQCRAYINNINDDIDYLWNLDSDEVYKTEDLKAIIKFLEEEQPTSVGVRSLSFYGGFDHHLTGFELKRDNFLRIFRFTKGANWLTHRPPTIDYPKEANITLKHIDSETLYEKTGAQMYHYSYVFPNQVQTKINYYKDSVSRQNCLDNYFKRIYIPWIIGDDKRKQKVEDRYQGVHEFKPEVRGDCYTAKFKGEHPEAIAKSRYVLESTIDKQLNNMGVPSRKKEQDHSSSWKDTNVFQDQLELNQKELQGPYPAHWMAFLNVMMVHLKDVSSILDVGCGVGAYSELLKKEGFVVDYTGIDYSGDAIELAKQTWQQGEMLDNVSGIDFEVKDYTELTKKYISQFDMVHMGAFLDVLPNGDEVLDLILSLEPKNLVVGRMKLTDRPSFSTTYQAYGKITTYAYHHNEDTVLDIAKKYGYNMMKVDDTVIFSK